MIELKPENNLDILTLKSIRSYFDKLIDPKECLNEDDIGIKMVEKHKYEDIGFQNGVNPITDTRAVGMLGPLIILNLFERLDKLYKVTKYNMDQTWFHAGKILNFK